MQTAVDAFTAGGVKPDDRKNYFDKSLRERITRLTATRRRPAHLPALVMSLWWNDAGEAEAARKIVADPKADAAVRVGLLKALAEIKAPGSAGSTSRSPPTTRRSCFARPRSRRSPTPATPWRSSRC